MLVSREGSEGLRWAQGQMGGRVPEKAPREGVWPHNAAYLLIPPQLRRSVPMLFFRALYAHENSWNTTFTIRVLQKQQNKRMVPPTPKVRRYVQVQYLVTMIQ